MHTKDARAAGETEQRLFALPTRRDVPYYSDRERAVLHEKGDRQARWLAPEAAPSSALRKWFGHDPDKWSEFQRRYRAELDSRPEAWQPILEVAKQRDVTLLFSSHNAERNNVAALKAFLDSRADMT